MAPDRLENGAQHVMKWHPVSRKMVSNVVFTSLIAGYLYPSFISLNLACFFHSQSFQKSIRTLLQVFQPLS